jgi:hypothetical protein
VTRIPTIKQPPAKLSPAAIGWLLAKIKGAGLVADCGGDKRPAGKPSRLINFGAMYSPATTGNGFYQWPTTTNRYSR